MEAIKHKMDYRTTKTWYKHGFNCTRWTILLPNLIISLEDYCFKIKLPKNKDYTI